MATGDSLLNFNAWDGVSPATAFAVLETITGASTPAEYVRAAGFDDTADESLDFTGVMPENYAGTTGITCVIQWAAAAATNNCIWDLAFRRITDDAEDVDTTAHTYVFNSVTALAPTVIGEVAYDTITFTDGADMDSVVAGDLFILRLRRDADNASDNLSGDARLVSIVVKET